MSIREQEREQKQLTLAEKLRKKGLAGQKLGKHKVPESELVVQLGEDLSESLRVLKACYLCIGCMLFFLLGTNTSFFFQPEGNLFRDRFQSLQQRALIEPRALVLCVLFLKLSLIYDSNKSLYVDQRNVDIRWLNMRSMLGRDSSRLLVFITRRNDVD
jgi:hypothetical protein